MQQVNKNGAIQNQTELDFQQDNHHQKSSAHSTIELKTQRSLCYAAGQEPGRQLHAAITNADVGKDVRIKGDALTIDGEPRGITWADAKHRDCSGKIKRVDEKYKGKVQLEDGQEFENGAPVPLILQDFTAEYAFTDINYEMVPKQNMHQQMCRTQENFRENFNNGSQGMAHGNRREEDNGILWTKAQASMPA